MASNADIDTASAAVPPKKGKRKLLVTIVMICIIALSIFSAFISTRPNDFRVEREETIQAPVARIFQNVNDFHRWQQWSPWEKLDPGMKRTFEGAEEGTGAVYRWDGNAQVGAGSNTIVQSHQNVMIRMRLEMLRPFKGTNDVGFTFVPAGDGTRVIWAMTGKLNFVMKIFHLLINMDKMVGGQFETGLSQLKTISESPAEN